MPKKSDKKLCRELRDLLEPFVKEELEDAVKFHKKQGRSEGMLDGVILKERMIFYKLSEERVARLMKIARELDLTEEEKENSAVPEPIMRALMEATRMRNEAYDLTHPPEQENPEE